MFSVARYQPEAWQTGWSMDGPPVRLSDLIQDRRISKCGMDCSNVLISLFYVGCRKQSTVTRRRNSLLSYPLFPPLWVMLQVKEVVQDKRKEGRDAHPLCKLFTRPADFYNGFCSYHFHSSILLREMALLSWFGRDSLYVNEKMPHSSVSVNVHGPQKGVMWGEDLDSIPFIKFAAWPFSTWDGWELP